MLLDHISHQRWTHGVHVCSCTVHPAKLPRGYGKVLALNTECENTGINISTFTPKDRGKASYSAPTLYSRSIAITDKNTIRDLSDSTNSEDENSKLGVCDVLHVSWFTLSTGHCSTVSRRGYSVKHENDAVGTSL